MDFIDLTIEEDDIQLVTNKVKLTNDQAIELATQGFTLIDNRTWYRRKRFDSILQAENYLQANEIIAETRTAVFILTRQQAKVMAIRPMLSNKLLVH